MAENVTVFGDIADKFDALVAYDEKLLDVCNARQRQPR